MKNRALLVALFLSSSAIAKVEVSGKITPTIKSGAVSASDTHTANFEMADAQLDFVATLNKDLTGTIVLYAGQDVLNDASAYSLIDEAHLTQKIGDASLKFGRSYLAFGAQTTNFISDPGTLSFGEMQTEVFEASYKKMGFTGAAYAYEASAWESSKKEGINSYGATLNYRNDNFLLGASYISNMSKSGILELTGTAKKMPAAYAVYANANYKGISLMAEYMSAAEGLNKTEYTYTKDGEDQEATPATLNVELAYTYGVMGKDVTVAAGYQMNSEVAAADKTLAPTQILLAGVSVDLYKGANLALEYRQASDEKEDKGGATDGNTAHMTTLAYSIEF